MLDLTFAKEGNSCCWIASVSFVVGMIIFNPSKLTPKSAITMDIFALAQGRVDAKKRLTGHRQDGCNPIKTLTAIIENLYDDIVIKNIKPEGSSILIALNRHLNQGLYQNLPTFLVFSLDRVDDKGRQILTYVEEPEEVDINSENRILFTVVSILYRSYHDSDHYACLIRDAGERYLYVEGATQYIYKDYDEWQKCGLNKRDMYGYVYVYGIKNTKV